MSNRRPTARHRRLQALGAVFDLLHPLFCRLDLPRTIDLPSSGPILMAGNHRSMFDGIVTLVVFRRFRLSARIIVKPSHLRSGPAGWVLRQAGSISSARETVIDESVGALRAGEIVAMMPEGRRLDPSERVGGVGAAFGGVARIAEETGAWIVPVSFSGTEDVWPLGSSLPRLAPFRRPTVRVRVGAAFRPSPGDHLAQAAEVMAVIAANLDEAR